MSKSIIRRALVALGGRIEGRPHLATAGRVTMAGLTAAGIFALTPAGAQGAEHTTADAASQTMVAAPQTVVGAPTLYHSAAYHAQMKRAAAARHRARLARIRAQRDRLRAERERVRARQLATNRNHQIKVALETALGKRGDPYVWGATGPSSFDCSGLTSSSYAAAGISIPRTAAEQSDYARIIPQSQVKPGDFVFFGGVGTAYHVGLFLRWDHGQGIMVDAPHTGAYVREEAIWTPDWTAGTLRTS